MQSLRNTPSRRLVPATEEHPVSSVVFESDAPIDDATNERMLTADFKCDSAWRRAMVLKMRQGGHEYSEDESTLIAKGQALFDRGAARKGIEQSVDHSKTATSAWTKHDKKSGLMEGRVDVQIRASPEEIVAFQMHHDSKHNLSLLNPELHVRYELLEWVSLHHIVCLYEVKRGPFQNRTFLNSSLWQKVSDAPLAYFWVSVPVESHAKVSREHEAHAVRAEGYRCLKCTRMGDNLTKMEFACSMDLKGAIPRALVNAFLLPQLMRTPYDVQNYFLRVVPLAALTCDDARILADALFGIRSGPSMLLPAVTDRVAGRMKTYHALDELLTLYPSLPTLFAAVLRKRLCRPAPVAAHLAELTTE